MNLSFAFLESVSKCEIVTNRDRKSTRLNSSHDQISYAVFCLKKKKKCRSCRDRFALGIRAYFPLDLPREPHPQRSLELRPEDTTPSVDRRMTAPIEQLHWQAP